ncbi:protein BIG GRAIN 1-like B [Lotus japonicus]|uniref:protein BIG GRAIN 1-like B n=1 Tax=Lotus japonicus TaxID=34305 RepID=UPI0025898C5A|nr:protein BIG GRAIN 1-like B [Lotus japonicus]
MEKWEKTSRDHRKQHHREKSPSFSSTLLDVIYRSIDEGQTEEKEESLIFYRETMRKQKQSNCFREEQSVQIEAENPSFRRTRKVENWTERRNSLTELERRTRSNSNTLSMYSSSSSSESSSAGGFSSSESESFYGVQRPKPIRTSVSEKLPNPDDGHRSFSGRSKPSARPNTAQVGPNGHTASLNDTGRETVWTGSIGASRPKQHGFGKTKSKALRILYGELKKAKQPVSPGARLASFLNSLFNSGGGNAKKAKVSTTPPTTTTKVSNSAQPSSTCSSASSFSRSCLSKTPSSRSGAKRSVRFCPVSVIVDEDCRPCGHKNLREADYGKSNDEELRLHVMNESRRVEELARELLKNYQKKNAGDYDRMQCEDEDDDDAESCSSSDLFELDNLSAIGIERYREELPVYETTHFKTNRAIANGFVM